MNASPYLFFNCPFTYSCASSVHAIVSFVASRARPTRLARVVESSHVSLPTPPRARRAYLRLFHRYVHVPVQARQHPYRASRASLVSRSHLGAIVGPPSPSPVARTHPCSPPPSSIARAPFSPRSLARNHSGRRRRPRIRASSRGDRPRARECGRSPRAHSRPHHRARALDRPRARRTFWTKLIRTRRVNRARCSRAHARDVRSRRPGRHRRGADARARARGRDDAARRARLGRTRTRGTMYFARSRSSARWSRW